MSKSDKKATRGYFNQAIESVNKQQKQVTRTSVDVSKSYTNPNKSKSFNKILPDDLSKNSIDKSSYLETSMVKNGDRSRIIEQSKLMDQSRLLDQSMKKQVRLSGKVGQCV